MPIDVGAFEYSSTVACAVATPPLAAAPDEEEDEDEDEDEDAVDPPLLPHAANVASATPAAAILGQKLLRIFATPPSDPIRAMTNTRGVSTTGP